MKRTTLVVMLLAILAVSCLVLTACHSCEFGEWAVIEQATCTEAGLKVRVCECGESRTEIIPATDHSYVTVVTDPTCTEQGFTTHTCDDCGESYVDTYVEAGHSYSAVETEPTCTKQGYTTHTCGNCGNSYVDTYVKAIGHSYSPVVTEPNCTEPGYTTHTCGNCGNSYVDTYVDGTHDFQQSDTCEGCGQNIVDVAVEICDMSATEYDSVMGYVVPRTDGNYDAYIKGTGAMKDYPADNPYDIPFFDSGYTFVSAYIGDNVTSIGGLAIYGCTSLTSIDIPDSVTSIGYGAFGGCTSLTSIVIPDSVTSIGYGAFIGCASLTAINVDEDNTEYKSVDGNVYLKDGKTLIQYAVGKTNKSFTIPDSVTSIGDYAFCGCTSLTSINIPEGLTSIPACAFESCSSLTSIIIPDSVTSIGHGAFANCSSLTSIAIPDDVISIDDFVFAGCKNLANVIFEDPHGWYVTKTQNATSGTNLTLTNTSTNATYFKNTYGDYYWYKK